MSDVTYDGLPGEVTAGTGIEVTSSTTELHQPVADLAAVAAAAPPVAVSPAARGEEQIVAIEDGTLTEPGRYLIVCAGPTGADVDAYLAAAGATGRLRSTAVLRTS